MALSHSGARHLVFVYGTLKRGHRNHRRLDGAAFVSGAATVMPYVLMAGRIPVMFEDDGTGVPVTGELYAMDDGMLAMLDHFEGHPAWYCRERIAVRDLRTGQVCQAFAYLFQGPVSDDMARLGSEYCEAVS